MHGGPNTSPRWQQVFLVITGLGSTPLLLATSALIAGGLLLRQYYVLAVGWIIGQTGGPSLNVMLKNAFERGRPEFADTFLAIATTAWVAVCVSGMEVALRRSNRA